MREGTGQYILEEQSDLLLTSQEGEGREREGEGGQGSEVGRERMGGQGGVLRHSEKIERPG